MANPSSSESKNPQTTASPRCVGCGPCKGLGVVLALLGLGLFAVGSLVRPNDAEPENKRSAAESRSVSTEKVFDEKATLTWRENFNAALEEAAAVDRPVLLRFTAEWCLPCQVMDKNVFPDESVQSALLQRAIPVKIDIDQSANRELAARYGIRGIPTMVLVDAQGHELARGGFMSAEALVEFLQDA